MLSRRVRVLTTVGRSRPVGRSHVDAYFRCRMLESVPPRMRALDDWQLGVSAFD